MIIAIFGTIMFYIIILVLLGIIIYILSFILKVYESYKDFAQYKNQVRIVKEDHEFTQAYYLEEKINDKWIFVKYSYSSSYGEVLNKRESHILFLKKINNHKTKNKSKWILKRLKTMIL